MALKIGYGVITCQRPAGSSQSWEDLYADELALAVAAEEAGFDSVWVSEHHFTDDGYLSAMFPMMAAIAARTSRVEIGTNVILAPMHHPLRLAEDAATVQCLSGGRLVLCLAIGYRDEEFDAWGVPKSERVPRIVEHLEVCRKAFTGERFSHSGPVLEVENLVVRPAPATPPPIWLGGWVDAAVERAGEIGDGYISPAGAPEDTRRRLALLDAAAERAGRDRPVPAGTGHIVQITDSTGPSEGMRAGAAHILANYGEWYSTSSDYGGGREFGEKLQSVDDPTRMIQHGPADYLLERLAPIAELSHDRDYQMIVRLTLPGVSREESLDHIAAFTEQVMPGLRSLGG